MNNIKKSLFIIRILYVISIIMWFYLDNFATINDDIKYVIILFNIVAIMLLNKNSNNTIENKNICKTIVINGIILVFISLIFQLINFQFQVEVLKQAFYLILPVIYAYILFSCGKENADFYFNTLFICSLVTFLILSKDNLNLASIFSISFADSYSPFEKIGMADIFLLLFCWYIYRNKKIFAIISALVCVLVFKRFHLIFMVIYFILSKIRNTNKNQMINKIFRRLCYFLPFIAIFVYSDYVSNLFYFLFNIDLNSFTMGRFNMINYILDSIQNGTYINLGLGTTGKIISDFTDGYLSNMHCDVLRITIETTYLGYFLLVKSHFKIIEKKYFSTLIMLFMFITMFLSYILTMFISWLIFYMFIFSEEDRKDERIDNNSNPML